MAFYSCNRYRLVVLVLISLILFQIFRLLPENPTLTNSMTLTISAPDLVKLEDDTFNEHKIDKVKVRVYYEALCIDSKYFFLRHLGPVTNKLADFIDVALVPYGKAQTREQDGKYYFICQHGEPECYGNKIHACAIELIGNMTQYVEFTVCLFSDFNVDSALHVCAKKQNVDKQLILNCATSDQGSALLKKYGDDTHRVQPHFIPTILLNGSNGNQEGILKNFLLEICKLIDMPLPPPCL